MKIIKILMCSLMLAAVENGSAQFFSIQNISHPDVSSCASSVEHIVSFENNFGQEVDDIIVTVSLPDGLNFESITGGDFTLMDGENSEEMIFVYSQVLGLGESLLLSYTVSTFCQDALPVGTSYHIVCDATQNPEENDQSSVIYNYLAASLNFITVTDPITELLPGSAFQRQITIRNAGNESISEAVIDATFSADGMQIIGTSHGFLDANRIVLNASDFSDGRFDPEEDFILTVDYFYSVCSNVTTSYTMTWGCSESDVCQQINTSTSTTFPTGEPNLTLEATNFENPGACQDSGYSEFVLRNESSELTAGAASAKEVKLSVGFGSAESGSLSQSKYMGTLFFVESVDVDGIRYPLDEPIVDPAIGNNEIYQIILPEVAAEQERVIRVNWYYLPPHLDDPSCDVFNDQIRFFGQMNLQANFLNKCGLLKPRTFCPGSSDIMQFKHVSEEFVSPTDAEDGETFTLGIEKEMNILGPTCQNPSYVLKITLPEGVSSESGTAYGRFYDVEREVTVSQVENEVFLEMELSENNYSAAYGLLELGMDVSLACPVDLSQGILYEVYLKCDDCPDNTSTMKVGCDRSFKLNAFCGVCEGIQITESPEVYRTTYGFEDETMTNRLSKSDVDALGNLNKVFTNDLVRMEVPAIVQSIDDIEFFEMEIRYNKFNSFDEIIFEPIIDAVVEIEDVSSGNMYQVAAGSPINNASGENAVISYVINLSESSSVPSGFTLDVGDRITFNGEFRITESTLSDTRTEMVLLSGLRYKFNIPGAVCNSKGAELYVGHPFVSAVAPGGIEDPSGCSPYRVGFSIKNQGVDNVDWFPGEFRPIYYPNRMTVKVPNEWVYETESCFMEVLPMDNCSENSYEIYDLEEPSIVTNGNGSTFLIWNNSNNEWPVKDDGCAYYQNQFALWFDIRASCRHADQVLDNLIFEMDAVNYYYAEQEFHEEETFSTSLVLPESLLGLENFTITALNSQVNIATSEVTWSLRVSNNNVSEVLENMWFYLKPTEGEFEVLSVTDLDGVPIEIKSATEGVWCQLPPLAQGTSEDFLITSSVFSCSTGILKVETGMDCTIDFDSFDPENFPCDTKTVQMKFIPEESEFQLNFEGAEDGLVMCENNQVELTINNALLGYVNDITVSMEVPEAIYFNSANSYIQYPGPSESSSTPGEIVLGSLPEPEIIANYLIWRLDDLLPDHVAEDGLPGAQLPDSNSIHLSLALSPTCPFVSGAQTRMLVNASKACGEDLDEVSTSYIELNIQNIQPNFSTIVDLDASEFAVCNDTTQLRVTVDIPEIDGDVYTTTEDQFQILIPEGAYLDLASMNTSDNAVFFTENVPVIDTVLSGVRYNWGMPTGLEDGDSFSCDVLFITDSLMEGAFQVRVQTINSDEIFCEDEACSIGVVQGTDFQDLEKVKCTLPIMDLSINPESGGCLGDSIRFFADEVTGMPVDFFIWNLGNGETSTQDTVFIEYTETGLFTGGLLVSNVMGDTLYPFNLTIEEFIDPYFEYEDFNVLDPHPAENIADNRGVFSLVDESNLDVFLLEVEDEEEVVFISPENGTIFNAISDEIYTIRHSTGEYCRASHDVTVNSFSQENGPIAVDDYISATDDGPVNIYFLGNDFDPNDDIVPSLTQVTVQPANGIVQLMDDSYFEYSSNNGFIGLDSLTYRIFDIGDQSAVAKIYIEVEHVPAPPIVENDFSEIQFNEPFVFDVLENDYDTDGEILPSSFSVISYPENGNVVLMQPGLIEYTSLSAFQGFDYLEYEICDNTGLCSRGIWTILVYDYTTDCELIFIEEEQEIEIENCQSSAHFCLPYDYEEADNYEVYIDGELQSDLPICRETSYRAYDFLSADLSACDEISRFPLTIDRWVIDGEEFTSDLLNDWDEVEYFLNSIDPCGFWNYDGDGKLRGGMIILNYEELVISSNCGANDLLSWEQFTIPQNLKVLLPAQNCYEVVVKNTFYSGCSDTIEVCVPCLGILNTPPYTVNEEAEPQDIFQRTAFSGSMMNYCLTFEDDENHFAGIVSIEESIVNPDVFYEPDDFCFCYRSPENFLGADTITVDFCDIGDPILCNQATIYIDVIENDGSNTPPFTTDIYNVPTDTIYRYVQLNEITEICLDFSDPEGDNVVIDDIIDLYEGSSVNWDENAECLVYSPPPGEVGADILMVNYCDDGFPQLCGATWIVIEIMPELPINTPPNLLDNGEVVEAISVSADSGGALTLCLEFYDEENHDVGLASVNAGSGAYVSFDPGTNCFSYVANSGFFGTEEVSIIFCDQGAPEGLCNEGTIFIEVTPGVECLDFFEEETYHKESSFCTGMIEVSMPIQHFDFSDFIFVVNNEELSETESFGVTEVVSYDLTEIAEHLCFINGDMEIEIQSWMYNGSVNNLSGEISELESISDILNEEDNVGYWFYEEESNILYSATNQNNYQVLSILISCNGSQFESRNFLPEQGQVFAGISFELEAALCHNINLIDQRTGCSDQTEICIDCVENSAPYAVDTNGFPILTVYESTFEDQPGIICLDLEDPDDGDLVHINTITNGGLSSMYTTLLDTWCIEYTPPLNYIGEDTLTVQFCDDDENPICSDVQVIISIEDINDPPVAIDDFTVTNMNTSVELDLLENDFDEESDPFFFHQKETEPLGQASIDIGVLSYFPPDDFCGKDEFYYSICDAFSNCSQALVIIDVVPLDSDEDGIADFIEGTIDTDDDGIQDYLDTDSDNDLIPDSIEAYALSMISDFCSAIPIDTDSDGISDYQDSDSDGDGISDLIEGYSDCDGDGILNYIDPDEGCDFDELSLYIPEGFSPNFDGENDLFHIDGLKSYDETRLTVFNRYGNIVYSALPYLNDWDGTNESSGIPLPNSTYYYILEIDKDIAPITGFVYILSE